MIDTLAQSTEASASDLAAIAALVRKKAVTAADVAMLRREVFADRSATRVEVEALFTLDRVARPQIEAWSEFLVEVVIDHVVWDARPTGVVEPAQAEWLLRRVDSAKTLASFASLVSVIDEAHRVPHWFGAAVRQRGALGWIGLEMPVGQAPVRTAA